MIDLWLLGYHHVTSTFTRLTFDSESFSEHKFLVLGLPWLVAAGTITVGMTLGLWALATTYLYWQWFHYTRQSYGIARIYSRKAGQATAGDEQLTKWTLYLLPLWGILYRSHQAPDRFLGMKVAYLPTSRVVVLLAAAAAVASLVLWSLRQLRAARQGRLSGAMALYMLSHFVVFTVGYVLIEDITHGWLVINVWHNAQYILIVWMFNSNRFKKGVDRRHWFLSTISQAKPVNIIAYFAVCLVVTTLFYKSISFVLGLESFKPLIPLAIVVVYQTINFHHYIVDGIIWKVRKKKLQKTLGLATG